MEKLICTSILGDRKVFFLEHEQQDPEIWIFRVHLNNPPNRNYDEWFEMRLVRFRDSYWRVDSITHNSKEHYSKKGIGDELILRASKILGSIVYSSSNKAVAPGEFRTCPAGKMWERIVVRDLATFDSIEDRYSTVQL